jgi:hypothetical protein
MKIQKKIKDKLTKPKFPNSQNYKKKRENKNPAPIKILTNLKQQNPSFLKDKIQNLCQI